MRSNILSQHRGNRREEYQFAKDYYEDLNDDETHAFILEKGFRALTGKSYSVPEIKYLLSFDKPSEIIRYRASSKKFIEFNYDNGTYSWRGRFKNELVQGTAPWWYLFLYVFLASIALFPIIIKGVYGFNGVSLIMFSLSLGFLAIESLTSCVDVKFASRLMLQQKTHLINKNKNTSIPPVTA